ncbi:MULTISPECIES: DUF4388 domain-containing protein [Anaeromyxobacter]|uniref:DUF4388 domain-containing protein n=1 Tax=Anaeromyxobacter TaxID=161492 RepID=UPI001F594464|nr:MULTISPECIES: DUF4388 domain-containing protein [unclassified Anaeromyxobacter]
MALTGTLKDFGIAEILQLIGQQAKTGVLHLRGSGDEIRIALADGCVVHAESAGRKSRERLGTLLVRAGLVSPDGLQHALEVQKRSLRRLGDVLVEEGLVSTAALKEMTALQTTETVYRLFHWKSGTYAFEPGEVEWDRATVTPLRAESVLMEGFRQVDEWPMIRKRITSTAMTFERLRPLGAERGAGAGSAPAGGDDVDAAFDAFGEEPVERKGEFASLGPNERRVHALAEPGRPVEEIVDLSRLGEFETCKALLALVNLGYLAPIAPARRTSAVGVYGREGWGSRLRRAAVRVVATVALAAALAGIATWVDARGLAAQASAEVADDAGRRFLARAQASRLRSALEIYRVERGEYPPSLSALVEADLASARDLRHPWPVEWYYRRTAEGRFVLLPPVE